MFKKITLFLVSCVLVSSCQEKSKKEEISSTLILISKANIVNVRTGEVKAGQNIFIDSGRIKEINAIEIDDVSKYKTVINAEGKYVIPGMAEMHAHIPQPPTSKERLEDVLFLYLANGVTTIRGMLGHPDHLVLREKVQSGEVLGPRIFTSSPSLNGNSVKTEEEAIEKVTAYQNEGYDFLKIHPGIQRNVFNQVVKTANEVGIPFAGHVPVDVGIRHALKSKYASIDHVDGFLEGLVPESKNVDPTSNGFFGYNFTPLADTTKIEELVQLSKDNKVWIVPTQSLFERWFSPADVDTLLAESEMKYMPKSTLENWRRVKIQTLESSGFNTAQWEQFDAIRKSLIKKLQDNGHGILLGSDAPQLFNVPGFSIQHEMQGMAAAGMNPLEILQSTTLNPSMFFELENTFGEVKKGADADLVLLSKNPMDDIKNYTEVFGVMAHGTWLSDITIEKRLKEIAENASKN
ncbi:amidohydrolase [Flagellimonas aquimarina]|uniref:Amidohydrolase n=1 Tax=Flagellimonas aquimarina TaxID=2201895 RepID=A0A316L074_9FLAO|nr:amidohydrolase family protein [Allomuricauda koreensis]PWL38475.1 amidohydrolase [Allomuricauda koreensis]